MFRRNKYIHRVLPALPLAALCLLTLSACSDDDDTLTLSDTGKTPIELTVGIVGDGASTATRSAGDPARTTRAVVTTDKPYNQYAAAFEKGTSLYMVMKSEDGGTTPGAPKYTRTIGYAQEKKDDNNTYVNFATNYVRYYEDSYSRNSKVSIYSVCVPGYRLSGTESLSSGVDATGATDGTTWSIGGLDTYSGLNSWSTAESTPNYSGTTIAWPLRNAQVTSQNADFIANQDLCFSNNVSNPSGGSDNRIYFDNSTKKFREGRMVFYHAMTKVTFMIKKNESFTANESFAFTNDNENIVLKGFNTTGTFDIAQGEFTVGNTTNISQLANTKATSNDDPNYTVHSNYDHVLSCLMLPGSALTSTATDEVYFTIDHNTYHITKSQLATALSEKKLSDNTTPALTEDSKMRPGVHYIFTMTVGKKKVEKLTASLVPWEKVTAENTSPSNARIQVSLLKNGTPQTGTANFDLYRSTYTHTSIDDSYADYTWKTGYAPTNSPQENKAYLTENTSNGGIYTANEAKENADHTHTPWYWPNNMTFYHFRTVMPKNHEVIEDATNGDYISIAYAPVTPSKDVCWGAPFVAKTDKTKPDTSDEILVYSLTSGFDNETTTTTGEAPNQVTTTTHQISKAIGPTEDYIDMEMFHMLSEVTINLATTTGSEKVDLTNAKMELSNIYTSAKVLMGNGLVVTEGDPETVSNESATNTYTTPWHYYFVPQALDNVVLTITTADHNQYIIDMEDVAATTVEYKLIKNPYNETAAGSGKYKIDRWYPNYQYTYTFTLKKSGVATITATLADWETVTAGDDNVQIK